MRRQKILRDSSGEILILDTYFSDRTLSILSELDDKKVKIMLANENALRSCSQDGKEKLRCFFQRYSNMSIKMKAKQSEKQHDRFIVTLEGFFLVGHGLKDIGRSGSFITYMPSDYDRGFFDNLKNLFMGYWERGRNISF